MSYTIRLYDAEDFCTEIFNVGNITDNADDIFRHSMGHALKCLHEMKAEEVITTLSIGVEKMIAEPAKFKHINLGSGLRSYDSALAYLNKLLNACKQYPDALVSVE